MTLKRLPNEVDGLWFLNISLSPSPLGEERGGLTLADVPSSGEAAATFHGVHCERVHLLSSASSSNGQGHERNGTESTDQHKFNHQVSPSTG